MNNSYIRFACIAMVLLSLQATLFAQDLNKSDYIVLNNGDTLYSQVAYINESGANREFYKKVRLQMPDGKRNKYKRKDIAAFRVGGSYYESFWLSQSTQKSTFLNAKYDLDVKNGEHHFLKVVSKGALSHYVMEWFEQGDASLWWMALLKKEEDSFFLRADQGLLGLKKQALLSYFPDCPNLQEGISEKRLNEVWEVVDFYNRSCGE